MAKFDFRVLLETVEGKKTSYMSQSFVDTSVDLVLSASQVYNRITGSVSCSYQMQKYLVVVILIQILLLKIIIY